MPIELKTSSNKAFHGNLVNISRGGALLETREVLPLGDLIRLRIEGEKDSDPEEIVYLARTVWGMTGHGDQGKRYGLAFLTDQGNLYGRVRRRVEIAQAKSLAEASGLRYVDVTPSMVEKRTLSCIDRNLAFCLNCVPIKLRGERLMVAMAEPGDSRALEKLQLFSRCKILPVVATPSAIKNTLIQCWGVQYFPSGTEGSEELSFRRLRQKRKPRILTLASSTPSFSAKLLAVNLTAVLNADKKRTLLADLDSGRPLFSGNISRTRSDQCECLVLMLSGDTSSFSLDWAIKADEALLIVSPSHLEKGYLYIEAAFNRFVETHNHYGTADRDGIYRQRVVEFSVVCAQIFDMLQGFKTFSRLETRVHQELDMREPGFDIRLHYVGGIQDDGRDIREAEKIGAPITILEPHSRASQCMTHIAQSLLRLPQARDPRIRLQGASAARFTALLERSENSIIKVAKNWALLAVILGLVSVFLLSHSGKDLGSSIFKISSIWLPEEVETVQPETPRSEEGESVSQTTYDQSQIAQPSDPGLEEVLGQPAEALPQVPGETWTPAIRKNGLAGGNRTMVRRSAIALAVENREPKGVSDRVSIRRGRVYCWVHVINGGGKKITVRWIMNGKKLAETHLPIGSNSWRTWACMTLRPSMIGPAQADILNDDGEVLQALSFEITG